MYRFRRESVEVKLHVSTLLEILDAEDVPLPPSASNAFQPFLRFWAELNLQTSEDFHGGSVSTLLEILGLVWLVVVGF